MPVNTWVSGGDDDGDEVHEENWCLTAKMQQDNETCSKCFAYASGEGIIEFIAALAGISQYRFAATCIGLQLACRWGRWVAATRKMNHLNSKLKFTIFSSPKSLLRARSADKLFISGNRRSQRPVHVKLLSSVHMAMVKDRNLLL